MPVPDPTLRGKREQIVLEGDVPSPANPPSGCRFHTRCFKAQDRCSTDVPELVLRDDGNGEHLSACHFAEPRVIVETIDVTGQVPDARFAETDVKDDAVTDGEPADEEHMRGWSEAHHESSAHSPQNVTDMIDEQRGDHRPPS